MPPSFSRFAILFDSHFGRQVGAEMEDNSTDAIYSLDNHGFLSTCAQIDEKLASMNAQDKLPRWAREVALVARIETLESQVGPAKSECVPTNPTEDELCEKAMLNLLDAMNSADVGTSSDVNLLYSNLNRVKKIFSSKPTMSDVMLQVSEMYDYQKYFSRLKEEVAHTIRVEAESSFWDHMEELMDRMKANEDFSMKNINKLVAKLASQEAMIEERRKALQLQRDKVTEWTKRLHIRAENNTSSITERRDYMAGTQAIIDEKVEETQNRQEGANDDFVELRDMSTERIDGTEATIAQTHEDFTEAGISERKRAAEMTKLNMDLSDFFDAFVRDQTATKNALPQTVMERQDFIDVIRYEQSGSRTSVVSQMDELMEAGTAKKIRRHITDVQELMEYYDGGKAIVDKLEETSSATQVELVDITEVIDNFPKNVDALEKKMSNVRGQIKGLLKQVGSLMDGCKSTINDVHELYSIKDEVETMSQTIENRETRVKRVRAELSAIEQSITDNGNLLKEAFTEIKRQDDSAHEVLDKVRRDVMDELEKRSTSMDKEVSRIQAELDELTGQDNTQPETAVGPVTVHAERPASARDEGEGEGVLERQRRLDGQTQEAAGEMAAIFSQYGKECEKGNALNPLSAKLAEKVTVLCMSVSDLMASSSDIDLILSVLQSADASEVDNIANMRAAKLDLFLKSMVEFAREAGQFTPLQHEALNKFTTLVRRVLAMNMRKHEMVLVDNELEKQLFKELPRCLCCDRPLLRPNDGSEVSDTVIVKRGHFPSYGDTTREQGSHLVASVHGGDFKAPRRRPKKLGALSQASTGLGSSSMAGSHGESFLEQRENERYKLVAGFRMKQSASMSSIGQGSLLR